MIRFLLLASCASAAETPITDWASMQRQRDRITVKAASFERDYDSVYAAPLRGSAILVASPGKEAFVVHKDGRTASLGLGQFFVPRGERILKLTVASNLLFIEVLDYAGASYFRINAVLPCVGGGPLGTSDTILAVSSVCGTLFVDDAGKVTSSAQRYTPFQPIVQRI